MLTGPVSRTLKACAARMDIHEAISTSLIPLTQVTLDVVSERWRA
jgi:hypothetical protein